MTFIRHIFFGILLATLVTDSATAQVPASPSPSELEAKTKSDAERAEYVRSHYTKFEYRIAMRDGVHLFTSVYVPNDASASQTYPMLLVRTPYSVAPYGASRYKERLGPNAEYEKDGFVFVFQDVRGAHMSEGVFVNMRPQTDGKGIDESTDTFDSIEWLVKNVPHNNGKVGQWGVSYPGFYTSAGAINSHPALKAVSPQAPIADWFRGDDMHRHGAFNLQLGFAFFSGFGKPRPEPTDNEESDPFEFGTPDGYQYFLDVGPLSNLKSRFEKDKPVAFWDEISAHPNYDDFWQSRNLLPHLKGVKAATLVVGGWYDTEDLYGPLATFRAINAQNPGVRSTLVMGPWTHGGWARSDGNAVGDADFGFKTSLTFQPVELAFFKHWLKGADDPKLPRAWVFETGSNRWRKFDAWPPAGVREKALYLGDKGGLSFAPAGASASSFDEFPSDPAKPVPYTTEISTHWSRHYIAADQRFTASRPDVLVYQSEPLERDITLAGPLRANLWVSTSATDADWVIKLIDVSPGKLPGWTEADEKAGTRNRGGQQTLVRGEPFRGRFRDGLDSPKPFVPDQPTEVAFDINDVFHTFQRGHRIMIQVQSSWFPFIDRNPQHYVPNIFEAKEEDFVRATHRVYRDAQHPSSISVGVLPALDE